MFITLKIQLKILKLLLIMNRYLLKELMKIGMNLKIILIFQLTRKVKILEYIQILKENLLYHKLKSFLKRNIKSKNSKMNESEALAYSDDCNSATTFKYKGF